MDLKKWALADKARAHFCDVGWATYPCKRSKKTDNYRFYGNNSHDLGYNEFSCIQCTV